MVSGCMGACQASRLRGGLTGGVGWCWRHWVGFARRVYERYYWQVYEGCCRLRVSFSQHTNLNVKRNSDTTWDFTNGGLTSP